MDIPQMDPILKEVADKNLRRKIYRDCSKLYHYHFYGEDVYKVDHVKGRIQNYIHEHPDDIVSKIIKEWLYKCIKEQYMNIDYINALYMKDDFKYTKLLEISKNFPFHYKFSDFNYYIYYLLVVDSSDFGGKEKMMYYLPKYAKEMHDGDIPQELFDKTFEFIKQNNLIAFASKEEYDSSEDEFDHLKEFEKNGKESDDYKKNLLRSRAKTGSGLHFVTDEEVEDTYRKEKKGRVGEYFIYNWLKTQSGKTTFVAKEYGNGFGYDILYNDPVNQKEYLVEVKSTTNSLERDSYFSLTDNELRVLNDTLNLPKSEFIIERVYIDLNQKENKNHNHYALYYDKDNKCFINNTDNPEYYIKYVQNDKDPLRFDKVLVKKNILTYKNNNQ